MVWSDIPSIGRLRHDRCSMFARVISQELKIAWCPTADILADPCTKSGADCTRLMNVLNVGHLAVTIVDVRPISRELSCRDPGGW
jgi:hypothetical protein